MFKKTRADRIFEFVVYSVLILVFIIVLYPLIYIISASISDPVLVNQGEVWLLPKNITFEGYTRLLQHKDIWSGYTNTIIYTLVGTIINVLLTITSAYVLSRKDLRGRNVITAFFVITMFFQGGIIPTYLIIKNLNLLDNFWVMILPNAVAIWNIIITRTYFQTSIPYELQEAAKIDGCSNIGILFRIMLPLSTPIIAVMALYYGVGHWNAFFNALIYLSDRAKYPLQLILREILIQESSAELFIEDMETLAEQMRIADLIKYSVIIVSTLPIIIIYPFLQKYFVKGIMIGAIKG